MPKPKKGESKKKYVARCIPEVIGEGKPPKEAAGKCYGMYDFYKRKKKKGKKNESFIFPKFSELTNENFKNIFIGELSQKDLDFLDSLKLSKDQQIELTRIIREYGDDRHDSGFTEGQDSIKDSIGY